MLHNSNCLVPLNVVELNIVFTGFKSEDVNCKDDVSLN